MRVSDLLRQRHEDSGEMGKKKSRGRKKSNLSTPAPPPSPRTLTSLLSRWLFNAMPAAGDREGAKFRCLSPFSSSCCRDGEEAAAAAAVEEEEAQFGQDKAALTSPATVDSVEIDRGLRIFGDCPFPNLNSRPSKYGGSLVLSAFPGRTKKPDAISFNLGMGAGLVFLLAKSATEFNKMVELRSEMETMLKYIKDEIQIKASAPDLAESKAHSFFPNSNYWESGNSNKLPNDDSESCNFRFGAMEVHRQPHRCVDMDSKLCSKKGCEMEEELQVELQRLQLHLAGQGSSTHPHQDRLFEGLLVTKKGAQDSSESEAQASGVRGLLPWC
ncbi:hypothetical protein KSP40_PGU013821 [Platanthera guangdongensis]|uniref:Uncharacterized protein n=1 Tax=Platanthera guangdongensis TaxID=2320717 RepID=A0ABR2LV88_9ASPA